MFKKWTTATPPMIVIRYRRKPTMVTAKQLTLSNISEVADWIRSHNGAVNGIDVIDSGPIELRGIRLGVGSNVIDARIGDWIVRETDGSFFVFTAVQFACYFRELL